MRKILLVVVLAVAGCAVATEVYTPDGRKGLSIDCSGVENAWSYCFAKAGEYCKSAGYDILAKDNTTGQYSYVSYANGILGGGSGTTYNREIVIACKSGR